MCVRPFTVRIESNTWGTRRLMQVPCGECVECVKRRQNDWKLRLCEEGLNWPNIWFFTLSYSDDTVPVVYDSDTGEVALWSTRYLKDIPVTTACKAHVQSWLKRVRERVCRKHDGRVKFKYFICAEYGSDNAYTDARGRVRYGTARPHYHGIIFTDLSEKDIVPFFSEWSSRYGIVDYSKVEHTKRSSRSATANYVSKYCCKGEFATRREHIKAGLIEPAWSIMSKNIGASYIDRMSWHHVPLYSDPLLLSDQLYSPELVRQIFRDTDNMSWSDTLEEIIRRAFVWDGSYKYSMPRYYRDRLYGVPIYQSRIIQNGYNTNLKLCSESTKIPHFGRFCISPPAHVYNTREVRVKRYSHENFLSLAMQYVAQIRHDADARLREDTYKQLYPSAPDSYIIRKITEDEIRSTKYREHVGKKALCDFYFGNEQKNSKLTCA